jgi:hypothetical protein
MATIHTICKYDCQYIMAGGNKPQRQTGQVEEGLGFLVSTAIRTRQKISEIS